MTNKIIVIAVILVAVCGIYWFGLRPSQIRKHCYGLSYGLPITNQAELNYRNCLRDNGLAD